MDYQQVEVTALSRGVNLRDVPDGLAEGEWRRLTNVRALAEGAISTRPGRRWVAGVQNGRDVHTLTTLGERVISGSGRELFRDGEAYPTTFTGRPVSWVKHRGSDGDERWLYVADGGQFRMLGEDGSDIKWGITEPTKGVVVNVLTDTGLLNSSVYGAFVYDWRYVYKNSRTGARSNPSPILTGTAVVNKKVKLIAECSLDGQVDTIEFCRRGGLNGLDTWRVVGAAPNKGVDPSTGAPQKVEFIDNVSDANAVDGFVMRTDNNVPFTTTDARGNAVKEAAFAYIWGPLEGKWIFACGDPNRPGHVYWTNPSRPHSASPSNNIAVSSPEEPLVGGFIFGGTCYCWTAEHLYALDYQGDDAIVSFVPRRTFVGRGLSLPFAFAVGPLIWFFSKDGLYVTDGQSPAEPFTETALRPLFSPHVEERKYIAPGALGQIQWPAFTTAVEEFEGGQGVSGVIRDFSISAPPSATVAIGGSGSVQVTVSSLGQFWGDVGLGVSGTPPPGVTFSFSPQSGVPGTGSFTSTLTISASASAVAGSFTIQVRGQRVGGSLSHLSDPITVTISGAAPTPPPTGSFTLSAVPSTLSVQRGGVVMGEVRVEALGGFAAEVALVPAGPAGVQVTILQTSILPPSAGATIQVEAAGTALLGTYTITITGTSGALSATTTILLTITAESAPVPAESIIGMLRVVYGGQELHVHYKDVLGQWVHLRNHLPYNRWSNDESPEVSGYGSIYETISYLDEAQPNTTLLIGTNTGLVAVERGTYDYVEGNKIQCRIRSRSEHFGAPRTLKELGNVIVEADLGDAVLPLALNPSQPTGIAFIPFINAETTMLAWQRVGTGAGRRRFPRAFKDSNNGELVFAYSVAVDLEWNGNATIYGWLLQFHPDEEFITNWSFGPSTMGGTGYTHIRDVYLTITNPNGALTPRVQVDGVWYALKGDDGSVGIPAGTVKRKVHLWGPPVKGKVYRWDIAGAQFKLYGNECEVRMKHFATGLTYSVPNPFAGGSAEV
jgi:hypothetical protein